MNIESAYNLLYGGSVTVLVLIMLCVLIRAVRGPEIVDRIVAVNMLGTLTIMIICILSLWLKQGYLLDVALIYATYADKFGNLAFYGSTRNFNAIMPPAAKIVIAEVDELSDASLDPNQIVVAGVFVDYLVVRGQNAA